MYLNGTTPFLYCVLFVVRGRIGRRGRLKVELLGWCTCNHDIYESPDAEVQLHMTLLKEPTDHGCFYVQVTETTERWWGEGGGAIC